MKISVIVPVYNVENYLTRCVDSILSQTYKNIEILLIDDGSTDASGDICNKYCREDSRVSVVHQRNGGLASARNAGIDISTGEYLTFIDSDDYVSSYYIENLVNAIKKFNADLSISMFINVVDGDEYKALEGSNDLLNAQIEDSHMCLEDMLYQRGIETSAPGKLYRKELIKDLRFPSGKLYEDIMFTTKMILRSHKIVRIENVDYFYYQRNNSIQYQKFNERKMDCIWHSRELVSYINNNAPDLLNASYVRYFGGLCNILFQIPEDSYDKEREFIWNDIKKYRARVLFDKKARFKTKGAALLSYFGMKPMKYIYFKTQTRGKIKVTGE